MDEGTTRGGGRPALAALARGAAFLAFWVVLIGADPGHRVVGLATALAATWTSLRLLPPAPHRLQLARLPGFALRFLWQSIVAGWDVARRAFDPRLPIRPGFVAYPVGFPAGATRNVFTLITSLMPGTVPAEEEGDAVVYHCLDVEQPVAAQLAAEEAELSRVLPGSTRHE